MAKHIDPSLIVSRSLPTHKAFSNLTGSKFTRLTVQNFIGDRRFKSGSLTYYWECLCDCGSVMITEAKSLKSGNTRSCGCLHEIHKVSKNTTHGMSGEPEYIIWCAMLSRCYNEKNISFPNYGGRGLGVCERWFKFENFFEDLGRRPKGCSIERRNTECGYSPENCLWATKIQQMRNTRSNLKVSFGGETKCVAEWAESLEINPHILHDRLRLGWTVERALTQPVKHIKLRA